MKKEIEFLKAINDIDDELIMEASEESYGRWKKPFLNFSIQKLAPLMSVMVLAIALTVSYFANRGNIDVTAGYGITVSNLAEAEKVAGFSLSVPASVSSAGISKIVACKDESIAVYYGEEEKPSVIIVKGQGSEDISGDYTEYACSSTVSLAEGPVTVMGNDAAAINKVIWTRERFSYAVLVPDGMSLNEILPIINATK